MRLPSWQRKETFLRKEGSAEDLCLLAEKDNNTLAVSPESEILWRMSYLFIHGWNAIPLAAEVCYFPCGKLQLWKGRAAAAGKKRCLIDPMLVLILLLGSV